MPDLILASASPIRRHLLTAAGLHVAVHPVRIDEHGLRASLAHEGTSPRDIADTLAEMKARKSADQHRASLVLGCDQVLEFGGTAWAKPASRDEAVAQLSVLRGQTHRLWSAAVLYHDAAPVWRHIGEARLTMRHFSDDFLQAYLDRNWPQLAASVGCYKIEEEGVRLFSAIAGDHFTILGLPLLPLLGYLADRGAIAA